MSVHASRMMKLKKGCNVGAKEKGHKSNIKYFFIQLFTLLIALFVHENNIENIEL